MIKSKGKMRFAISLRRRTIPEWLALLILILPFCFGTLTEIFMLPDFVRFIIDGFLVYFAVVLLKTHSVGIKRDIRILTIIAFVFFLYTLATYFLNFESILFYIWGFRNLFRFYIAFFVYITYFDQDQAKRILDFLDVLFWINIVVSLIQFVFLDVRQDYLGGIFGSSGATNGYTTTFFCIVIAKSLLNTFSGKEKLLVCSIKCVSAMVVAAMAEMKFFFFLFVVILAVSSVLTRLTWKKLVLIFICVVALIIGSNYLSHLFGSGNFFTFDFLVEYVEQENYSSEDDLARGSAITELKDKFFNTRMKNWFGLGLGNCEISDVSLFSTPFSHQYGYLHYTWFASPMVFLETGHIGLALFFLFFVACLVLSFKKFKKPNSNTLFCQLAIIMSVISIIISFYNSSLRIESAYYIYFILALPFIDDRESATSLRRKRRKFVKIDN